jgi:hypothetical protein
MWNSEAKKCSELLLKSGIYTIEELNSMDDVTVRVKFLEHFDIFMTGHINESRINYYYILKSSLSELICEKKAYKNAFEQRQNLI